MKELIFVGRSTDNLELLFMDEDGQEFAVEVDDHIRRSVNTQASAAAGDANTGISPRDIQTRIRRGETAADIAAEAGVDEDRINRYAGPVLAERSYMAKRATETFVRRPKGDVLLGELATTQLDSRGIDVLTMEWDSYRREDGRWNVSVSWASGSGSGAANWIFDPLSRSIVALDDEARWLFDEAAAKVNEQATPEEVKPRLVGLPTAQEAEIEEDEELEPPAWAGPGHPTMPVPMPVANQPVAPVAAPAPVHDDSPSWDDILFGHRPSDQH